MCKVGEIDLSYECLTSPEVRQALVGLRDVDPALYEQLSIPSLSAPVPPPPEHDGSYPEDKQHDDDSNEVFVDSSLSVNEVVAWIADDGPGAIVDWSGDEDEGINSFGHEDSCCPAHILELFDSQFATSSWTRWDGTA